MEIQCPLLASTRCMHFMVHRHTGGQNTTTYKIKKKLKVFLILIFLDSVCAVPSWTRQMPVIEVLQLAGSRLTGAGQMPESRSLILPPSDFPLHSSSCHRQLPDTAYRICLTLFILSLCGLLPFVTLWESGTFRLSSKGSATVLRL